jgi:hypothetical protein
MILRVTDITALSIINQLIFVMVKCCVFFEARMSFGFKGLMGFHEISLGTA